MRLILSLCFVLACVGCGSKSPAPESHPKVVQRPPPAPQAKRREQPPRSAAAKDIKFPAIQRTNLDNGLEVNVVELDNLPVVYLRLVIRSGSATDPKAMPGVAGLTADMLKEGTRRLNSAKLAEAIEFYGADLTVGSDADHVYLSMQTMSQHLDAVLALLAEVVTQPAFRQEELNKLTRREQARLDLQNQDPYYLASKQLHRVLYKDHPYAQIDTTSEVLKKVTRKDLIDWHAKNVLSNNAFLVVVGKVKADSFNQQAKKAFSGLRKGEIQKQSVAAPKYSQKRQIYIVNRPTSVQSVILWGNLALHRGHPDYIPLVVANQVLGGSAASRLFMDLREKRSLTYGAYSRVDVREATAPFRASAAVRTEVTAQALEAFEQHLVRIRKTAAPGEELANAHQYLSDSFPLKIETAGSIAGLVAELRLYGLPDGYWDDYRSTIRKTSAEQALKAAKSYITPDQSVIVVVGNAAEIAEPLRRFGPVTVVDAEGKVSASVQAGSGT